MSRHHGLRRRDLLRVTGGALAGASMVGVASADDETVRVNVGYDGATARRLVAREASTVVYDHAFDVLTVKVAPAAVDGLRAAPGVRFVEPDREMHAIAQDLPWGIDRVDAEVAHANGSTGSGADLAILDTGISQFHSDLTDNLGEGVSFLGGVQNPNWQDDNGHGTHCAGIADAVDNSQGVVGVSTAATLHAVKVLTAPGVGLTSDIAAGLQYTADQGWDVASMSLGGGGSSTLEEAVAYADGKGVLIVAAAGNSGPCSDCVSYPAAYSEVVAVSATDSNDNLASFSSTGPEVDIAAPGDSIYSTFLGGYATLSGTSMACPHVSGAAAQLIADGYSADQARQQLLSTAEDCGLSSNEQGAGLLDVAAALGYDSSDDL